LAAYPKKEIQVSRIAQTIRNHPVVAYFVMVYALAWCIWIPAGILTDGVPVVAVLLGAWAPSISAIILTGYLTGRSGVRLLLRRILIWRVGIQWYLFVLFSTAIIGLAAILLFVLFGGSAPQPSFPPGVPHELGFVLLPVIFLVNIFIGGSLSEEYGWRGFALPYLQKGMSAFWASLIIGVLWGIWHLPFFIFESSVVGGIPAWAYVLLTTAWSVLFSWVFNNGKGSILLMVLYHASLNTTLGSFRLIDPSTGGETLLILYIILTWLVALLVSAIYGPSHLARNQTASNETIAQPPFRNDSL
jgi:membrane protease YdiL (CAAX protease family)